MSDLIRREDAIKVFIDWGMKEFGFHDLNRNERFIDALSALPSVEAVSREEYEEQERVIEGLQAIIDNHKEESAEADLSEYCDRLWKIAYERGKVEAEQHNKDAISREGLLKSWEELSPRGRAEFDQVIMTIPALPSAEAVHLTCKTCADRATCIMSVPDGNWKACKDYRASADVAPKIDHDRDWIIGCIEHDGFIHTHRFDRANQIIHDALSAEAEQGWKTGKPKDSGKYMVTVGSLGHTYIDLFYFGKPLMPNRKVKGMCWYRDDDEWGDVVYDDKDILAWMPLPKPYKGGDSE